MIKRMSLMVVALVVLAGLTMAQTSNPTQGGQGSGSAEQTQMQSLHSQIQAIDAQIKPLGEQAQQLRQQMQALHEKIRGLREQRRHLMEQARAQRHERRQERRQQRQESLEQMRRQGGLGQGAGNRQPAPKPTPKNSGK